MKGRTYRHGKGWAYAVDIGPDPASGKRRRKVKAGFAREKDAATALNTVLTELAENRYTETSAQTLKNYLVDEWLPSC